MIIGKSWMTMIWFFERRKQMNPAKREIDLFRDFLEKNGIVIPEEGEPVFDESPGEVIVYDQEDQQG
mgnify:CR=1 FL=1